MQCAAMGLHKTGDRSEHLKKVGNRAARVTEAASPGTLFFRTTDEVIEPFALGNDIQLRHVGVKALRGIQERDITLNPCKGYSSNSELPNFFMMTPLQDNPLSVNKYAYFLCSS